MYNVHMLQHKSVLLPKVFPFLQVKRSSPTYSATAKKIIKIKIKILQMVHI